MRTRGIWFFGESGVGKTFLSNKISKKISKSFLIDGDDVRKLISKDLSFSKEDRAIQCKRLLGIANISIKNRLFPIVSSAFLTKKDNNLLLKKKFAVVRVYRKKEEVLKKKIYKIYKKDIVGKDIHYEKFKHYKIYNNKNYLNNINIFIKKLKLNF
jgi:adenylylsulfate kinase